MEITRIKEKKSLHTFKDSTQLIATKIYQVTNWVQNLAQIILIPKANSLWESSCIIICRDWELLRPKKRLTIKIYLRKNPKKLLHASTKQQFRSIQRTIHKMKKKIFAIITIAMAQ